MTKTANKKYSTPEWLARAMQGVTYWVGHRRSLYHHYPLGESALIAEFCNLLFANIGKSERLVCEVPHSSILKIKPKMVVTDRTRADLVIFGGHLPESPPSHVFEIKRASAPAAQIKKDLLRLLEVKRQLPEVSAFLVVISEANRLDAYVDEDGKSRLGRRAIPGADGTYRVRLTKKAAHAY